mgnify:CR=1 FL=1
MSDTPQRAYPDGRVVQPLYTEGPALQAGFRRQPWWTMVQEHAADKEFAANHWALARLSHGASGLLFYLYDHHYLPRILKDIDLRYIHLHLVVEGNGAEVMEALLHHAHNEVVSLDQVHGCLNIDPLEAAARTGSFDESKMYELGELSRLAPPNMRYMCVNATLYGNSGASAATQLALATAHLDFYLDAFGSVGLDRYWIGLTSSSYLFQEMAKVRAVRLLWARLLETYDLPATAIEVYCETPVTDQTAYDVHSNLLRATSAAFGAVVGGADQVQIKPYDALVETPSEEGERLALNQHFLLAYESYLDRTEDPAAGSYFVETLTQELCEDAWAYFQEIKAQGGLLAALEKGTVQDRIASEVERAEPEKVLGVNLFPQAGQRLPEQFIARPARGRDEHKALFQGASFEPLRPIRWAAAAEYERAQAEFNQK